MKGIEFVLLAAGAILGAYIRYKITSFPLILGIVGSNVLVVNILGSFILGIFSVLLVNWNLSRATAGSAPRRAFAAASYRSNGGFPST